MDKRRLIAATALAAFAIPIPPTSADQLLVIKPVVNEVLGHLGVGIDGKATFLDCQSRPHDPKSGTIKQTQDTCQGAPGLFATSLGDYLHGPVFDIRGQELGTIESLAVDPDGTKVEVVLDDGSSIPLVLTDAVNWSGLGDKQSRLMVNAVGDLSLFKTTPQ